MSGQQMTLTAGTTPAPAPWQPVCRLVDLVRERGAAALVDGEQVALVRLLDDTVLAVQNLDPFSGAHVMSRGIVGSRGDVPTLASPMYKQVFDLQTGRCLETAGYSPRQGLDPDLRTWPIEVRDGVVHVGRFAEATPGTEDAGPRGAA